MRVAVRTFASLRELSVDRCDLELPDGATLSVAWDAFTARYPASAVQRPYVRAARNGAYADWTVPLADDDEVAFLPPVSGGSGRLTGAPIDIDALERSMADPEHGALVTFVGRARSRSDDGREVMELEYEAFDQMAETVLAEIVDEAARRWDASVEVVHRTGAVAIGDAAVAIVTAAAHRAEAYEANRFVIEAIKDRLPIWKRERFTDGSEWKRPGA